MLTVDTASLHLTLAEPDHPNVPESGPVPLLIRVARPGEDEPNAWLVRENRRVCARLDLAESELASAKRYAHSQTREGMDEQRRRSRAARMVKAKEHVPAADWKSWVCDEELDTYKADVDELIEHFQEAVFPAKTAGPAWCWATREVDFEFDIEDAIDNYCGDNHHEDAFDLLDVKPLTEFYAKWAAEQNLVSYEVDLSTIVVIDPARFEAELAEAHALLESSQ